MFAIHPSVFIAVEFSYNLACIKFPEFANEWVWYFLLVLRAVRFNEFDDCFNSVCPIDTLSGVVLVLTSLGAWLIHTAPDEVTFEPVKPVKSVKPNVKLDIRLRV